VQKADESDAFLAMLGERLAAIPGVVAVTLGGSRARGTHRPDSDWDFGLYYRDTIDADDVRGLGFPGEVASPGDWAHPMNGGAWLTVENRPVDLLYRDLSDVERSMREADAGRWELFRVPGFLCGMASYVPAGEVAIGRVLHGDLPSYAFPDLLAERGPTKWRWEAAFAVRHARAHARLGDIAACLGKLAQAVVAEGHARLLERKIWALNDKRVVADADLGRVEAVLRPGEDLLGLVERTASGLGVNGDD